MKRFEVDYIDYYGAPTVTVRVEAKSYTEACLTFYYEIPKTGHITDIREIV